MKIIRTDAGSQSWLRSANCDARYGITLIAALAALLCVCAAGVAGQVLLRYDRAGLARGEWWRLLSAHGVHLGPSHALLNCAGLVLLWVLFAREYSARRWIWILLVAAGTIDAGLWFLAPEVDWYLGASGVLHGALAAGAVAWYRRGDGWGATLLLLLIVKLIYEQSSGASVFASHLPLIPQAHLFGALGGLIGAMVPRQAAKPL